MRSLILLLLPVLAACTSNAAPEPAPQQGANPPAGGGAGAGAPGGGAPAMVFNDAAINLGKAGGFPSDLVSGPDGTLYTVDDAAIPAKILEFTSGTQTRSVALTADDLIDMDATQPARAPASFGPGLFGAFTGDIELVFGRWLLVTVGGGNSVSTDGTDPLRLANLVVVDSATARVVQTVNLAWTLRSAGLFSDGGSYQAIPQSLPVMCKFVAAQNGTQTGRVYVALSNGAGPSAGLARFYQGTVQEWRADFTAASPLSIETADKASTDVTRTYVSENYNPVGLTRYTASNGASFMILTAAGASLFDAAFVLQPTTDAILEFLDLDTSRWRPQWALNLGAVLPAVHEISVAKDLTGLRYGLLASQTFAAAYVVDLSGLEANPVDRTRLRLLRAVDLAPGGSLVAGTGFQPGMALSPTGGSAVISSFNDARLIVLGIPGDVEFGLFEVNPGSFATTNMSSQNAFGLSAVVVEESSAFVIANGNFDENFLPTRPAFIGSLWTAGQLP